MIYSEDMPDPLPGATIREKHDAVLRMLMRPEQPERWIPQRGDFVIVHGREARVMALAEGWVVMRHKGCGPFMQTITQVQSLPHCWRGERPKGWGKLLESGL